MEINAALSKNASRTWYTIKIKLKLRKWGDVRLPKLIGQTQTQR